MAVFVVGFVIMFSAIFNLGNLARQRTQALPFLLALIVGLGWQPEPSRSASGGRPCEKLMTTKPALLGGPPAFPGGLPFARPTIENPEVVLARDRRVAGERAWSPVGLSGAELEDRAAAAFGVGHCVAVASATAGLMLVIQASTRPGLFCCPRSHSRPPLTPSAGITGPYSSPTATRTLVSHPCNVYDQPALIIAVHVSRGSRRRTRSGNQGDGARGGADLRLRPRRWVPDRDWRSQTTTRWLRAGRSV